MIKKMDAYAERRNTKFFWSSPPPPPPKEKRSTSRKILMAKIMLIADLGRGWEEGIPCMCLADLSRGWCCSAALQLLATRQCFLLL